MAEKIRVIGYTRVSTEKQVAGKEFSSIEAQRARIRNCVAENPQMELVGIIDEPGKSGKNMNRPGIKALIKHIRQGDIKLVISYKLDRISRDIFDYYEFEKLIKENNAEVFYTNDANSDGTPSGELNKRLRLVFATFEREQTVQRIKDKVADTLRAGYKSGGYAPIGYKCGDRPKTMEIDEETAPMVREIFSLFADRLGIAGIVRHMSDKYGKMPPRVSRNGKIHERGMFTENKIGRILRNPIYAGYVFTKKGGLKLFDGLHKPLVDRNTWHEIQKRLDEKPKVKKIHIRERSPLLLKKYLFCSCGANMTVGGSGKVHKDGSPYRYYVCSRKNHLKAQCSCNTRISLNVIESVLFSAIGRYATNELRPDDISKNESEYKSALLSEKKSLTTRKSNCERDLKNAAKRFATVSGNSVLKNVLEEQLQSLSTEVEQISSRLNEVNEELLLYEKNISLGDVHNRSILENLDCLQKDLTLDERREIVKLCVKKAVLKAKTISHYKREFLLVILPTSEEIFSAPSPEISFTLDNSNGKGEWMITAPFVLKCDNFGKASPYKKGGKIKRHWLHEVARWKKELESGATHEEIAANANISRSMVTRKLILWDNLSPDVIEHILKLKYEKDTRGISFRFLERISKFPKSIQGRKLILLPMLE